MQIRGEHVSPEVIDAHGINASFQMSVEWEGGALVTADATRSARLDALILLHAQSTHAGKTSRPSGRRKRFHPGAGQMPARPSVL